MTLLSPETKLISDTDNGLIIRSPVISREQAVKNDIFVGSGLLRLGQLC
jgi:hypothetical protein